MNDLEIAHTAYTENELGYHQLESQTVEGDVIPNASAPELKALLANTLDIFKQHEGHAEHLVASLQCVA